MTDQTIVLNPPVGAADARVADYIALLKPRVMSLVVFTGFAGL
ncbi:MAG: protoheme IX farnesyltransferase, partial [Alphaproteobacteria bacterium]